ncbi:unnamed protein product [Mytilus coruscus]|uniref:Uncharacterized protein n=1 Tax=Mytilus coruscus TaxID=42192 RepID=A0A6J8AJF7_MYTCO|nr:unnamed protein product [Mytilus coruscus]
MTYRESFVIQANSFSYDKAYHTYRKTWKAASDKCGSDGLEFDENVLTSIDVLYGKEFWIGMAIYRVTTPWIEMLVQSVLNSFHAVPDGQEVKKSPSIVFAKNNVNHISSLVTVKITDGDIQRLKNSWKNNENPYDRTTIDEYSNSNTEKYVLREHETYGRCENKSNNKLKDNRSRQPVSFNPLHAQVRVSKQNIT